MAYRFNGTDPFLRASIGAFNGYRLRGNSNGTAPQSAFALLKRNNATQPGAGWDGIWTVDQGNTSVYVDMLEFDNANHLAGWNGNGAGYASAATFTDTANWMIVGYTWTGVAGAGTVTWWWKIGTGAWQSETDTGDAVNATTAGSTFRHVIGNEPNLGDDADFDLVCVGAIKSALTSTQVQSLTMTGIASWDAVFTGAGAWLLGFDAITTRNDRTGNGGNEVSRSGGITLVSDPAGFSWGGGSIIDSAAVAFTGDSSFSGAGAKIVAGGGALTGASAFSGAGATIAAGGGALTAQSGFSGAGALLLNGGGALTAQSGFSGAGALLLNGGGALTGDSNFSGAGAVIYAGGGAFVAESLFIGAGDILAPSIIDSAPVDFSAQSSFDGAGALLLDGSGAFSASSDFAGAGALLLSAPPATLAALSDMAGAGGVLVAAPAAAFSGESSFVGAGDLVQDYIHFPSPLGGVIVAVDANGTVVAVAASGVIQVPSADGVVLMPVDGGV